MTRVRLHMLGKRKEDKGAEDREAARTSRQVRGATLGLGHRGATSQHRNLGEALVHKGVITKAELDEAVVKQQETGDFVGQVLIELGHVTQDSVVSFLVKECKIPHLSLLDYEINSDLLDLIPKEVCLEHNLLPIDKLGKILTVAMVDPLDAAALDQVRKLCPDLRIKAILCDWQHFHTVCQGLFGASDKGPKSLSADSLGLSGPARPAAPPGKPATARKGLEEQQLDAFVDQALATVDGTADETPAPETAPPPGAVAEAPAPDLAEAVRAAMEDAVASMAVQLRAAIGGSTGASQGPSREEMVVAMQHALEQSQAAQENRIAQLVEAAMETARAARTETVSVATANLEDLTEADEKKLRARHASVRPFGGTDRAEPGELADEDVRVFEALGSEKPVEGFTFEGFFAGQANSFTYKLSEAVAANPGAEHNPFFLFGNVGVGKTHLVNAIGNAIAVDGPDKRVGYVSASHFARRLAKALREQALDMFRKNYCHWDVLILDDIQFLGGRIEAQEEFFHIFNVLHQEDRQIIIAGDKAPEKLGLLERRLVSRFSGGIVAELKPPEMETRLAILRHHIGQNKAAVPDEIVSLVAIRVPRDVRMMVGALRKIIAFARLIGQDITYEMATEILGHLNSVEAA